MSPALIRLLQLASPTLPVGAFSYSQGLEWAVEAGTVYDEASALRWIGDQLEWNLGRYEAPLLAHMIDAWKVQLQCTPAPEASAPGGAADTKVSGGDTAMRIDMHYLASREGAELRAETLQMGYSLRRLLSELGDFPPAPLAALEAVEAPSYALAWSCAAAAWEVECHDALAAWLWSWAENQVMAALKAVPLGQAAGQRILQALGGRIPAIVERARALPQDAFSNFAPAFAIACARHETQYSRLFRS